jgi:hypothetical protein
VESLPRTPKFRIVKSSVSEDYERWEDEGGEEADGAEGSQNPRQAGTPLAFHDTVPRRMATDDIPETPWHRFRFERAYDGDTPYIVALLDEAKGVYAQGYMRLMGVQCPEIRGGTAATKAKAQRAKSFTEAWLSHDHLHGLDSDEYPFLFYAICVDKYGRWLAHVECIQGHCLNDDLIAEGHAVSYLGPTGISALEAIEDGEEQIARTG